MKHFSAIKVRMSRAVVLRAFQWSQRFAASFTLFGMISLFTPGLLASSHHPQAFLDSIAGSKQEAKQIVKHFCAMCHAVNPLIPLGAPRMGRASDWEPRLKQGMNTLFKHTNEGLGLMPARGGCFECSDEQLQMAIQYLLSESNTPTNRH